MWCLLEGVAVSDLAARNDDVLLIHAILSEIYSRLHDDLMCLGHVRQPLT